MQMAGFPRGADANLVSTSPVILIGVKTGGTTLAPANDVNTSADTVGTALLGVSPLIFDTVNGFYRKQLTSNSYSDGNNGINSGSMSLQVFNGATWDRVRSVAVADGFAGTGVMIAGNYLFNGTNWDRSRSVGVGDNYSGTGGMLAGNYLFDDTTGVWNRQRSNTNVTLLASGARTTTTTTSVFGNGNARTIAILCNVTVNPGGAQTLQLVLRAAGISITVAIITGTANALGGAAGTLTLCVGPGVAAGWTGATQTNSANTTLARNMDVQIIHSGAGSWTYSVEAFFIL